MKSVDESSLMELSTASGLQTAPGGGAVVFVRSLPNAAANGYSHHLWQYQAADQSFQQLTKGGGEKVFCLPSEGTVLYAALPGEADKQRVAAGEWLTVFHRLDVASGQSCEVFRVPLLVSAIRAVGEGLFLLSATVEEGRPDVESLPEAEKNATLEQLQAEKDFVVCDELPFFADGRGFINKKRAALFLYSQKTGALTRVTPEYFETACYAVSPNGAQIAFAGVAYRRMLVRPQGVYVYNVAGGGLTELVAPGQYQVSALDFMGEDLVLAASPWNGFGPFPNHHLYLLGPDGGGMRLAHFHEEEDLGVKSVSDLRLAGGTAFKVVGQSLYYITTKDAACIVNCWQPGAAPKALTGEDFVADCFTPLNGELLVAGCPWGGLQELYALPPEGGLQQPALSGFHTPFARQYRFAPFEREIAVNADGTELRGFVLYPAGYNAQKRYPGILQIHGGPRAAYTGAFHHEMQLLAAKGYFVFFCNPRGSAGRGETFADIQGRRGTIDYEDLMCWTDHILRRYPAIAPARLAVMGGSYGGYMTNWVITHTNRFAAAVSMRSIADVTGSYGATDYGIWGTQGAYGATPWQDSEKLRAQSPYTFADRVQTPTLFIHAFEDYRCSLSGAMQMYSALQLKGVPTRMCLFRGEGHELSRSGRPRGRLRRLEEILNWVEEYVPGGAQ